MDKETNKLKLAGVLANAMIREIKDKNLIKDVALLGDGVKEFLTIVTSLFSVKLTPLLLEFFETDEIQEMLDDEDKEQLELFKTLLGGK